MIKYSFEIQKEYQFSKLKTELLADLLKVRKIYGTFRWTPRKEEDLKILLKFLDKLTSKK